MIFENVYRQIVPVTLETEGSTKKYLKYPLNSALGDENEARKEKERKGGKMK